MNPHCRISRVRMKNGGADVRVLHSRKQQSSDYITRRFWQDARDCVEAHAGQVAGYALIVLSDDESATSATIVGDYARLKATQLPDYLRASFQRRLWRRDARSLVDQAFGYDTDDGD